MTLAPGYEPRAVLDRLDSLKQELFDLSLDIHSHPEVAYTEVHAHDTLTGFLEKKGFEVVRHAGGVDTAFTATIQGKGAGPTVAILVEYDALPGIGHACGHNLIAMSTIGASLGVQAAIGSAPGKVVVVGTPAEEGGGGKVRLLDAGVFEGADVALSSHPASHRTVIRTETPLAETTMLANVGHRYQYYGKSAHAAGAPHEAINALNAVIHLFTGVDSLRQHVKDDVRIHGIITDGGKAVNVIPDFAEGYIVVRSRSGDYLAEVLAKVQKIAEAAAMMTGARLEIKLEHPLYLNVVPSNALSKRAKLHAEEIGMKVEGPEPGEPPGTGSTDLGNVSQVMPTFALSFAITTERTPGHSIQMREAAKTPLGLESAFSTAKVLALNACDLLTEPDFLAEARSEFQARKEAIAGK